MRFRKVEKVWKFWQGSGGRRSRVLTCFRCFSVVRWLIRHAFPLEAYLMVSWQKSQIAFPATFTFEIESPTLNSTSFFPLGSTNVVLTVASSHKGLHLFFSPLSISTARANSSFFNFLIILTCALPLIKMASIGESRKLSAIFDATNSGIFHISEAL